MLGGRGFPAGSLTDNPPHLSFPISRRPKAPCYFKGGGDTFYFMYFIYIVKLPSSL